MRKKQDKPKKPVQSFGNAMSALSNLCFDYQSLNIASMKKQQLIQNRDIAKKIQVPTQIKNEEKKIGIVLNKEVQSTKLKFKLNLKKLSFYELSNFVESTEKLKIIQSNLQYLGNQLRIEKIIENPNLEYLYQGDEIKQGSLGDCYLISAISCLANKPNVLNRIIDYLPTNLIKEASNFRARLFDSGMYKQIIIKNQFPINQLNELSFAKSVNGDISPPIIQKAYAQLYHGYKSIEVGYSCDALRDLTGAPTQYIDLRKQQQVIKKLTQAFQQNYVLTISSKTTGVVDVQFIIPRHCYSIQGHKQIKYQNQSIYLLKLKNPLGGKFSKLPPDTSLELEKVLKQEIVQDHGIFWIPYKVLQRNFEVISSCLLHPKYMYRFKTFSQKQLINNAGNIFLKVNSVIHGYISINQIHTRHFLQSDYHYQVSKIIVARVKQEQNSYYIQQTIVGNFGCKQTCTIQVNFKPGQYLIFVQLNNIDKKYIQKDAFTVSFYTSSNNYEMFESQYVSPDYMIINYIKNNQCGLQLTKSDKIIRYFGDLFGYVIIYYENISNKLAIQEIEYQVTNVKIDQKKFEIPAKSYKLIKNLIGRENNCSHKCQIKTHTQFKAI